MKLVLKFKDATLQEFITDKQSITMGRDPGNDIVIDNRAVSRYHTRIYRHEDDYIVEDMDSGNGTLVNDTKISKAVLHDKDTILIGKHTLLFLNHDETASQKLLRPDADFGEETYILDSGLATTPEMTGSFTGGRIDVLSGGTSQTSVKLRKQTTVAGKNPQAEIKLRGWFVGDVAFTIRRTSAGFTISHAAGLRRTRVNGQPVQGTQELKDEDVITVGAMKLQFHDHTAGV